MSLVGGLAAGGIIAVVMAICLAAAPLQARHWPWLLSSLGGVAALVVGLVSGVRLNEVICGAVVALVALVASQVPASTKASVRTKDGKPLVEMTSMKAGPGGIEMRGKLFGQMPQTMYVEPKQLLMLIGIIPFGLITHLPGLLWAGWRSYRAEQKSENK
jgi:hypothetical protein